MIGVRLGRVSGGRVSGKESVGSGPMVRGGRESVGSGGNAVGIVIVRAGFNVTPATGGRLADTAMPAPLPPSPADITSETPGMGGNDRLRREISGRDGVRSGGRLSGGSRIAGSDKLPSEIGGKDGRDRVGSGPSEMFGRVGSDMVGSGWSESRGRVGSESGGRVGSEMEGRVGSEMAGRVGSEIVSIDKLPSVMPGTEGRDMSAVV